MHRYHRRANAIRPYNNPVNPDSNTLFNGNIKWNLSGKRREASRLYGVVK